MEASGTTLTEIFGVGPILAAKSVGIVGDVSRFASKAHFASYAGVAPMEASSGEVVRHRLSLAGNRRLNQVMHMIAVCQARSDHMRGGAYHRKKLAEGKSRMEVIRCLKRGVSDAVVRYAGRRFGARFSRTRLTQRGLTIVITWVFNNTRASLLLAILVHASIDTFSITLGSIFPARAVSSAFPLLIGFGVVALVLIVLTRGRLDYGRLAEAQPAPRVR